MENDPTRYVVCMVLADGAVHSEIANDIESAGATVKQYCSAFLPAIVSISITPIPA